MSSKDDDDNENDKTLMSSDDDYEAMSQNKKNKIMKGKYDFLGKIIDKSKSFEEQIKSLKKRRHKRGLAL